MAGLFGGYKTRQAQLDAQEKSMTSTRKKKKVAAKKKTKDKYKYDAKLKRYVKTN